MSTISINTTNNSSMGQLVSGMMLGNAFNNAKKIAGNLCSKLDSLKEKVLNVSNMVSSSNIDVASTIDISIEREEETENVISNAYDKFEEFIKDVEVIDGRVADKINELKKDFYNKHYNLKPYIEKGFREHFKDRVNDVIGFFYDAYKSIKKFVVDAGEWIKKHWKELLIGLCFIFVCAVFCWCLPGAAAFFTVFVHQLVSACVGGLALSLIGSVITYISVLKQGYSSELASRLAKNTFVDSLAQNFMISSIGNFASSVIGNVGFAKSLGNTEWVMSNMSNFLKMTSFNVSMMTISNLLSTIIITEINNDYENLVENFKYDLLMGVVFGSFSTLVAKIKFMNYNIFEDLDDNIRDGFNREIEYRDYTEIKPGMTVSEYADFIPTDAEKIDFNKTDDIIDGRKYRFPAKDHPFWAKDDSVWVKVENVEKIDVLDKNLTWKTGEITKKIDLLGPSTIEAHAHTPSLEARSTFKNSNAGSNNVVIFERGVEYNGKYYESHEIYVPDITNLMTNDNWFYKEKYKKLFNKQYSYLNKKYSSEKYIKSMNGQTNQYKVGINGKKSYLTLDEIINKSHLPIDSTKSLNEYVINEIIPYNNRMNRFSSTISNYRLKY